MNKLSSKKILYYTPRVLSIIFTIFISLFALDVFSEGYSFWMVMLALLMHLIPTLLLIVALIIAWKKEYIGGTIFIALGLLYIIMSRGQAWILTGPLFLIGILFLLSKYYE